MTSDVTDRWAFTFGYDHRHPVTNESLANKYIVVEARSFEDARDRMISMFGTAWAFQYTMSDVERLVKSYGLTEISWSDTMYEDYLVRRVDDLLTKSAELFLKFSFATRYIHATNVPDREREVQVKHARRLADEINSLIIDWVHERRD